MHTRKKRVFFPPPTTQQAMKITTRSSNASKHPGIIDGGGVKHKRRTRAEIEADAAKKNEEKVSVEEKKRATIKRIAVLEAQMVKQDAQASRDGRCPQTSGKAAKVAADVEETGSEFQPCLDEEEKSDDTEFHEPENKTPTKKKMKLSIQKEIKKVNAMATEAKVGFPILLIEWVVTINPA